MTPVSASEKTRRRRRSFFFTVLRGCEINRRGPRERGLGRMARRERGAYPLARPSAILRYSLPPPRRSVIPQLRDRRTPQSSLALRVASLFGLCCVARRSQIAADMLPPRALHRPKINSNATPSYLFHSLLENLTLGRMWRIGNKARHLEGPDGVRDHTRHSLQIWTSRR